MHSLVEKNVTDSSVEQEIQAKGKTALRVTPEVIDAVIASEHYFTGLNAFNREGSWEGIGDTQRIKSAEALSLLTFCVLVLRNGFTVTGESACVSPENFDSDIGRRIAREKAIEKIWLLEGYLLKQRLYDDLRRGEPAAIVRDDPETLVRSSSSK